MSEPIVLFVTPHAVQRFRERIEPIEDDAIQAWAQAAWRSRAHGPRFARASVVKRRYRGEDQHFLCCRSPGGRRVYLALSADHRAVKTVLGVWHWQRFIGERPSPEAAAREALIMKLLEAEREATP